MSVTQKDVGKRVKFITNFDGQSYRYGKLDKVDAKNSHVTVEPDRFVQMLGRSQLIGTDRLLLAEVQLTKEDVGKTVMWKPPGPAKGGLGKLMDLRPHSPDERLTSCDVEFFDGRRMVIWAKHVKLNDGASSELPNWQDISTAPKDRPILLCDANTQEQAVCEWYVGHVSWAEPPRHWIKKGTVRRFENATHWAELLPMPQPVPKTPREVAEANLLQTWNDRLTLENNQSQSLIRRAKANYFQAQIAFFNAVEDAGGIPKHYVIKLGKPCLMASSPYSHWSSEKIAAEVEVNTDDSYRKAAADRLLWLSQQRHYEKAKA